MCGIAGFSLSPADAAITDTVVLTESLLWEIEYRGTDATGFAYYDKKGGLFFQKRALRASKFILDNWVGASSVNESDTAILHTRAATQGSFHHKVNNHPIVRWGEIIGVHNGIIYNDNELFAKLGAYRYGEVDSEALFAGIFQKGAQHIGRITEGDAAAAWFIADGSKNSERVLHIANFGGRPLWIAETPNKSVIFASTKQALIDTFQWKEFSDGLPCSAYELIFTEIEPGEHRAYRQGKLVTETEVYPVRSPWWDKSYKTTLAATDGPGGTIQPITSDMKVSPGLAKSLALSLQEQRDADIEQKRKDRVFDGVPPTMAEIYSNDRTSPFEEDDIFYGPEYEDTDPLGNKVQFFPDGSVAVYAHSGLLADLYEDESDYHNELAETLKELDRDSGMIS